MKISYPPPPDRVAHDAKHGVEATYYLKLDAEERKVEWTVYLHLPEGMHWKKGDEMGLGSFHHEKTQTFQEFLAMPFRPLSEAFNYVTKYVQKHVDQSESPAGLPPLRYDGFPRGGNKVCYKTEQESDGVYVTFYIEARPLDGEVRWSFFPHLPEGICAKKGDETGLGSMHSDGRQSFHQFREAPKCQLPEEILAMVLDQIKGWPSKEEHPR